MINAASAMPADKCIYEGQVDTDLVQDVPMEKVSLTHAAETIVAGLKANATFNFSDAVANTSASSGKPMAAPSPALLSPQNKLEIKTLTREGSGF